MFVQSCFPIVFPGSSLTGILKLRPFFFSKGYEEQMLSFFCEHCMDIDIKHLFAIAALIDYIFQYSDGCVLLGAVMISFL